MEPALCKKPQFKAGDLNLAEGATSSRGFTLPVSAPSDIKDKHISALANGWHFSSQQRCRGLCADGFATVSLLVKLILVNLVWSNDART